MIIMIIFSALVIAFYLYNLACHIKAKEFFWTELPDSQKESVNYIGYKKVLFVTELPHAKNLCAFLNKRNSILREFNSSMAGKLINSEKRLCIGEILLLPVFLFWAMQIFKVIQ